MMCNLENQNEPANRPDDLLTAGGSTGSKVFVESSKKLEDVRSTAYTFTIVGGIGFIAVILLALGILPLKLESFNRTMMAVVMGILFLIFFGVGIRSFLEMKSLKQSSSNEEIRTKTLSEQFFAQADADKIDHAIFDRDNLSVEQLYFRRYEVMKQILLDMDSTLEESYLDYLIESFYGTLFPEN